MATLLEIAQAFDVTGGGELKSRINAAMATYANYILGGGSADPNRIFWAKEALQYMDAWTERIRWGVSGNAQFQLDLAAISDPNLQTATENAVNAIVPLAPPAS